MRNFQSADAVSLFLSPLALGLIGAVMLLVQRVALFLNKWNNLRFYSYSSLRNVEKPVNRFKNTRTQPERSKATRLMALENKSYGIL